jgi:hypothetical protein
MSAPSDPQQEGASRQREGRLSPADMRAEINQRVVEPSKVRDRRTAERKPAKPETASSGLGFLARIFGRKAGGAENVRQKCCVVGVLMLLDRSLALDGLVLELGDKTLLFRQGASFILDRTGAEISIRFGEFDRRGTITEVNSRGYVITLFEALRPFETESVLAQHGIAA